MRREWPGALLARRTRTIRMRSFDAHSKSATLSKKDIRNRKALVGHAHGENKAASAHCFRGEGKRKDRSTGAVGEPSSP